MYFCRLCYTEIKNVGEVAYCMHCRMPFHRTCIESYVKKHFQCPQCKVKLDMTSIASGSPPVRGVRREEVSTARIGIAQTRKMPHMQSTRRIDLSERRKKKINVVPLLMGMVLLFIIIGGGYLAVTKLPKILSDIENQKPPTPFSSTGNPLIPQTTTSPNQSLPPQTSPPGKATWFSWLTSYLTEWSQGRSFQYSQEIYYSTRTVKSDIKWKMALIVTVGSEKAMLTEVSMTTPVTESTNLESSARRWVGVDSKKCIKVESSTGGKRKEGNCSQSLFGAGVDFEAIPSWESSAKPQGQEEVTVPAGTFAASKISVDTTIDGTPASVTIWYVEGKLPVKIEVYKDGKLYMLYQLVSS